MQKSVLMLVKEKCGAVGLMLIFALLLCKKKNLVRSFILHSEDSGLVSTLSDIVVNIYSTFRNLA